MKNRIGVVVWAMSLASCASLPPPVPVMSASETSPPAEQSEMLGHPAIWAGGLGRDRSDLVGGGFVVTTVQTGGVTIHDLQGAPVQRIAGPVLNDIDIAGLPLASAYSVLFAGPERRSGRTRIALFRLDRGPQATARRWGEIRTDLRTPRGFCMRQYRAVVHAVVIDRRGEARQFEITEGPDGEPLTRETRRFRVSAAGQGCMIDPAAGAVYVSHARQGFWRLPLDPRSAARPVHLVTPASRRVPRSIGVALIRDSAHDYLVSLDQDRSAFSVWSVVGDTLTWMGRFEVREPSAGRAVHSLAGIDAFGSALDGFPNGLVVVQDQADDGSPNLKYVDWLAVKRALGF